MQNFIKWFYRKLAKHRLVQHYKYDLEMTKILEEYVTKRLLDGGNEQYMAKGRQQLVQHQREIHEKETLLAFLKTLK